ncbi:hypothetical protein HZH68_008767 [Vespula germanica]|uniref:Uncharacterized protein n=1 Tax=Vespula germanica TaxID=30212 RepID=A0A834N5J1_VESGE|nr:hypothetical protein HZH68_008767 [Vespula germanica]
MGTVQARKYIRAGRTSAPIGKPSLTDFETRSRVSRMLYYSETESQAPFSRILKHLRKNLRTTLEDSSSSFRSHDNDDDDDDVDADDNDNDNEDKDEDEDEDEENARTLGAGVSSRG